MRIGTRPISEDEPPYIIAEIGSNHNGDMELCRDLVSAAAECGADAAKFQSWSEDSLISSAEFDRNQSYSDKDRHFGSLREMVRAYQLTPAQHELVATMCGESGVDFLSSAFSKREVEMLVRLGVPAVKLASMDINHPLLIEAASSAGVPVILSTGMATLTEIARAVEAVEERTELILLHCVSLYPAAPKQLNLRNLPMLRAAFGWPVGFSDHSKGTSAAVAAVALGAVVIEKHFTIDRKLPGWDHWMSATPDEFKALCDETRAAHAALGGYQRTVGDAELLKRKQFRRCIVLAKDLPEGHVIGLSDLEFKRPGTGISPELYSQVVGRRVVRQLPEGHELTWSDLA